MPLRYARQPKSLHHFQMPFDGLLDVVKDLDPAAIQHQTRIARIADVGQRVVNQISDLRHASDRVTVSYVDQILGTC